MPAPSILGTPTSGQLAPGNPLTVSYEVLSGNNKVLLAFILVNELVSDIVSVTWNGDAMTLLTSYVDGDSPAPTRARHAVYYIINPDEGTHNCVATFTHSNRSPGMIVTAVQDADLTSLVTDGVGKNSGDALTVLTTNGITTTRDNSLVFVEMAVHGYAITPSEGQTERHELFLTGLGDYFEISTIVKETAGNLTVGGTWATAAGCDILAFGIKGVAVSGPAHLKTFNGIAKANVKTVNGVAIANVKTFNGVT